MSEEVNNEVFLRPRFKIDFEESETVLLKKFKDNLTDANCKYCSKITDNHIFIDIPPEEDHFWSPQLHLEIVKENDELTFVKGLFSPKPQVWTLFMFLHFAVGITFLIFLVVLYVKWTLESSLIFPMVMVVLLPVIWIAFYVFGRWGRSQGKGQMMELHDFMMETLYRK